MLNCSANLAMSTSGLKALPGKLDIKRHSPSILYLQLCKNTGLPIHIVQLLKDGRAYSHNDYSAHLRVQVFADKVYIPSTLLTQYHDKLRCFFCLLQNVFFGIILALNHVKSLYQMVGALGKANYYFARNAA